VVQARLEVPLAALDRQDAVAVVGDRHLQLTAQVRTDAPLEPEPGHLVDLPQ
jgi:hypothetical protein